MACGDRLLHGMATSTYFNGESQSARNDDWDVDVAGGSAEECSEFQDGSLTVVLAGDEANVFWVFDGGDDSGGQLDFLPHLVDVEDVGTGGLVSFKDVLSHLVAAVGVTEMGFGGEQLSGIAGVEFETFHTVRHVCR